jgi:hypothetical protein
MNHHLRPKLQNSQEHQSSSLTQTRNLLDNPCCVSNIVLKLGLDPFASNCSPDSFDPNFIRPCDRYQALIVERERAEQQWHLMRKLRTSVPSSFAQRISFFCMTGVHIFHLNCNACQIDFRIGATLVSSRLQHQQEQQQ